MLVSSNKAGRNRTLGCGGFTLLELIIVLVVLVALAALVIPTLGFVRDQAGFATSAAGAAELLNNLELYKASTGKYPNRLDSLINTSGTVYTKVYGSDGGTPLYGRVSDSSDFVGYFLQTGGGITHVMQHTESVTDPNTSTDANLPVEVYGDNIAPLYVIDPTMVTSQTSLAKIRRIVRAAYPNQTGGGASDVAIPEGHWLVALGVGSRSSIVGTTLTSAPVHGTAAADRYSRYIAVFDVSAGATGRGRVQLKMVCDSEFEVLAKNVDNYRRTGPVDDEAVFTPPTTPEEPETP